ncbi:MAG TPA: DUF881 domain-containing protein [Actinomycetota bacterium]
MTERSPQRVGLTLVLALFGFLLAVGVIQERLREEEESSPLRRAQLESLVQQRRDTISELAREVERLAARVDEVQRESGRDSEEVRGVLAEIAALEARAGVAGVQGPGLVVELSDSPEVPQTLEEVSDLRIQDVDVQLVVNSLWRAGAEAISVNGLRVASTTAIRKAGSAILVNYRAVASPYRVSAIGSPEALESGLLGSEIAQRFEVWEDVYGLGFEVGRSDRVVAPALAGLPELRWAAPEGGAS